MKLSSAFDAETRTMLDESIGRLSDDAGAGATWAQLSKDGWLALGLAEAFGGAGEAIGDLVTLLRTAGAKLWRLPLVSCLGEACGALMAAPAGPERHRLLAGIASGEIIAAFVDAENCTAVATPKPGVFLLEGSCRFLESDDRSGVVLVLAGAGLFAIDASARLLQRDAVEAIDGRTAVTLTFNGVAALKLADAGDIAEQCGARAQILAAAEAAGISRAALNATISYLAVRRQFGQPILKFQAVQHRLVELHIRERELSALLLAACAAYDRCELSLTEKIWRLRAVASKTAISITQEAIQLHGGMGMTTELSIGAYYKRALQLDALYGSYECALEKLAGRIPTGSGEIA
jgi:alkylation response protein AidB-like acyl-CoA dehydrogenase